MTFTLQQTDEGYIAAFPSRMNHGVLHESLPWPTPDQAIDSINWEFAWDSQVGEAMDAVRPVIEKYGAGVIVDALINLAEVMDDNKLNRGIDALKVVRQLMDYVEA